MHLGLGFVGVFFQIGEITHRDVKPLPNDYSTASHPSAGTSSLYGKYGIQDVLGMANVNHRPGLILGV